MKGKLRRTIPAGLLTLARRGGPGKEATRLNTHERNQAAKVAAGVSSGGAPALLDLECGGECRNGCGRVDR